MFLHRYKTTKLYMKIFLKRLKGNFSWINFISAEEAKLFYFSCATRCPVLFVYIGIRTPSRHVSRLFSILQIISGLNESHWCFNRENTTFLYAVLIITATFFLLECACWIVLFDQTNIPTCVKRNYANFTVAPKRPVTTKRCRLIGRYFCFYNWEAMIYLS